jgi:hypothetical protein
MQSALARLRDLIGRTWRRQRTPAGAPADLKIFLGPF